MSDVTTQVPKRKETLVRLSSPWLAAPLAALLLAGCAGYQRFDAVSVVSLNPLFTETASPLNERDFVDLEGSWVATNKYEWQVAGPPLNAIRSATNDLSQLPNALRETERGKQKTQQVELVTTLVIQAETNLTEQGFYRVSFESQTNGMIDCHSAYLGRWVKVKDLLFLDLFPGDFENSSFMQQATQRHYIPTHWFLKVEATGKTLQIGRLSDVWLYTLLEKRPRSLRHAFSTRIVLTDSPEGMQRFLKRHARNPEAFNFTTFYRSGGN